MISPCDIARPVRIFQQPIAEVLASVPSDPRAWLSCREQRELGHWKNDQRREAYLAGRWLAKRLIEEQCRTERSAERTLRGIEILSRTADLMRGTVPRVKVGGERLPFAISISHTADDVAVAIADRENIRLGIDLVEMQKSLSASFRELWFGQDEKREFELQEESVWSIAWGVKEAVFKALGRGESFAPREIVVHPIAANEWRAEWRGAALDLQIQTETRDGVVLISAWGREKVGR